MSVCLQKIDEIRPKARASKKKKKKKSERIKIAKFGQRIKELEGVHGYKRVCECNTLKSKVEGEGEQTLSAICVPPNEHNVCAALYE